MAKKVKESNFSVLATTLQIFLSGWIRTIPTRIQIEVTLLFTIAKTLKELQHHKCKSS
jgi:hypothetical protein